MLRFNTEGCDIFMARSWRLREKAYVYEEFSHRNSGYIIGKSSFFLSLQPTVSSIHFMFTFALL
jgi:hypothetical protein